MNKHSYSSALDIVPNDEYTGTSMNNVASTYDPDAELIQRVAQGNEKAFEQLVKKYQYSVFNTIYRYIGYYDDVEDVAQEVFIKTYD